MLNAWVAQGELKYFEDHAHGLEHLPSHCIKMFGGDHKGKLCLNP